MTTHHLRESVQIALRCYSHRGAIEEPEEDTNYAAPAGPSDWVLIFDTETTRDEIQRLRFGCFQIRRGRDGTLYREGFFVDPGCIRASELDLIEAYATPHGLEVLDVETFIEEVFFEVC